MKAPSGLTLELILNSSDYFSQLLSLSDNRGRTLRGFLVCHVVIIMQRSLERLENLHILMRENSHKFYRRDIQRRLPDAS